MASEFGQAYEESLDGWAKNRKMQLLAEDPTTKKSFTLAQQRMRMTFRISTSLRMTGLLKLRMNETKNWMTL